MSGAKPTITYPTPVTRYLTPKRSAISLTEVLIAMGILAVGLLGVASIFPVGGWQMQKAEVADRGAAIAQSVMSDIITRGMLNPRGWYVMVPWGGVPAPVSQTFPSDGKYAPGSPPVGNVLGKFARPFSATLGEALSQSTAATDPTLLPRQFGSAYVIDPIGMAAMTFPNGQNVPANAHGPAASFPASAYYDFYYYAKQPSWANSTWAPWSGGGQSSHHGFEWPVRRVTFRQPSSGWQMDKAMAEHFFRGSDDITFELPTRADRPAQQKWDTTTDNNANVVPLARQWTGDYSWIVTIVPGTRAAQQGMATNPEGYAYDVSVVVFYKRPLPQDATTAFANFGSNLTNYYGVMSQNERAVAARVMSSTPSGGELLLSDMGGLSPSPFEGLKVGQWVMLCAPHPNSSTADPTLFLNWYQVLSIEGRDERLNNQGTTTPVPPATDPARRLITVRGPEWPWVPNGRGSDNICVGIFPGAVAVHSKTIRLESPIGASAQAFGVGGNSTYNVPDYTLR